MRVLVIGGGLAALMGAARICRYIKEKGRTDIQIEIFCDGKGASPYVHGFNIPLHENDSVETFIEDTMKSGYGLARKELVEALCMDSLALVRDMEELGVELEKDGGGYVLLQPLGSSWPRVTGSGNHTGPDILAKLTAILKEQENVEWNGKSRVLRLDVYKEQVRGAFVWNRTGNKMEYHPADAVLIAGGGFCGIYPFSTNSADIGGDMAAMAYEAGIPLMDMEFIQFEPCVAVAPPAVRGKGMITTMFYEGAVLRNAKNERFLGMQRTGEPGECVGKDVLARKIYEQICSGFPTGHGGVYFDATGVGRGRLWEKYPSYMERYQSCGIDISREMFEIAPAPHTSLGGIVIRKDGSTRMGGIFAAGEAAGGIHGANRIGGNAGLETLVFGKRAAKSICNYLEDHGAARTGEYESKREDSMAEELLDRKGKRKISFDRLGEYRKQMQRDLQDYLYIVREEKDLRKACQEFEEMLDVLQKSACGEAPFEKMRLENDMICALLLAKGALTRKESVGCHVRLEKERQGEAYHVILQKENGNLRVFKENVEKES